MKKIISMILALILMFTLASCTKSTAINMADISTPALEGIPKTAYGIQFETNEDWTIVVNSIYTYVYLTENTPCFIMFMEPMNTGTGRFTKTEVEGAAKIFSEDLGSNATVGDAYQLVLDGKDVWAVEVTGEMLGLQVKITIWLYRDGTDTYTWMYLSPVEEYETYLPYAQALVKSMKLP